MDDREIESLLKRYRPMAPAGDLRSEITDAPGPRITRTPLAWPWALAAGVLLAISVGLHAAAAPASEPLVEAQRIDAIAEALGGSPGSEAIAEWMARRERRAEEELRIARAAAPEVGRQ